MNDKRTKRSIWLTFDRILSHDLGKQVLILLGILAFIFVISTICLHFAGPDWQAYCQNKRISKWVFPFYLLIDGNAFSNFYMDSASSSLTVILTCIFYFAGIIVFTGMTISVMTNMISRRVEKHQDGLIHYLKSGHIIIMGYDDMVPSIIDEVFTRYPGTYVLLMTSIEAFKVSERLRKSVASRHFDRIIINYGHRTTIDYYRQINLEKAREIYIAGYRSLPAHDAINVECVDSICDYLNRLKQDGKLKQVPSRITCVFEDLDTYAAFKTTEIFNKVGELGIEFVPYNFYAGWARQVFVNRKYKDNAGGYLDYPPVYGPGISTSDTKYVHLVFVGTTNFAVAFAQEAAQVLHFPNFNRDKKLRTRITFIEVNADKEISLFATRNRHFFEVQPLIFKDCTGPEPQDNSGNYKNLLKFPDKDCGFLDVEYEFIKGNVFSREVQSLISEWANKSDEQYLSIFLTLADQRENFIMGMNMPDNIYDQGIPIFIRQDRSDNFVINLRENDSEEHDYSHVLQDETLVTEKRKGRYSNIYPFGMNDMSYSNDETLLKRAKLINLLYTTADYSTYRFTDIMSLNAKDNDEIMKMADEAWSELQVAKKWSNLYCAYCIPCKLASLRAMRGLSPTDTSHDQDDLNDDEILQMAIVEHNRWNVEKLLMGFRKPLPEEDIVTHPDHKTALRKNKDLYIHSDIRPFDQLDGIKNLDMQISKYIPWIIKMAPSQ